jgi:dipeptidyl-peptidase 4
MTNDEIVDYQAAERFNYWNINQKLYHRTVTPNWIEKSEKFWYLDKFKDGKSFKFVDSENKEVKDAFNHQILAENLTELLESEVKQFNLPFNKIKYAKALDSIEFKIAGKTFELNVETNKCILQAPKAPPFPNWSYSPDKKWCLYVKNFNIFIKKVLETDPESSEKLESDVSQPIQLTFDGENYNTYGGSPESNTHPISVKRVGFPMPPFGVWSNDSKKVVIHKLDERAVSDRYLIQSTPKIDPYKPKLHVYKAAFPGEPNLPIISTFIIDIEKQSIIPIHYKAVRQDFMSPIEFQQIWWSEDNSRIYYIFFERYQKIVRLLEIEPDTGKTKVVLEEASETYLETSLTFVPHMVKFIRQGKEVIWFSERNGYGNLYLYDVESGALKHQITKNKFPAKTIENVDEENGWVYYTTFGRDGGLDPYYVHLHRTSLEGTKTELLTPEADFHTMVFSPNKKVFIDSFNRVNTPSKTVLRTIDGHVLIEFENADISYLDQLGWKRPEAFCLKARDNTTDIYGVIFYPTHFDPTKKYPILDSIYPGPQVNKVLKSLPVDIAGDMGFWSAQFMAELGFIIIMVDGLGTPFRSKKFHDYSYKNFHDVGGLPDHIKAIKELATERPYLDIDKVGIFGHSGGGFASAQAILQFPDFYKVAVATAGNLDQRGYISGWGELYSGDPSDGSYEKQIASKYAKNLKGKLLLIHGEMDDNVPPALTMQLVDELIKENKDFDMLIMPNKTHACSINPYFQRKRMDYFVKHLLGKLPPKEHTMETFPMEKVSDFDIPPEFLLSFQLDM